MILKLSTFNYVEGRGLLEKAILSHPFNKKVQMISLITNVEVPLDALPNGFVVQLRLADLVSGPFLTFIRSNPGCSTMITMKTRLEVDPFTMAIDNQDTIWINLSKHLYERFGLLGQPISRKLKDRFIVRIDLRDDKLQKGSGLQQRILECASRLLNEPLEFQVSFTSSSAAEEFRGLFSNKLVPVNLEVSSYSLNDIMIPAFPKDLQIGRDSETFEFMQLEQWIGLVLLQAEPVLREIPQDPFICGSTFDPSTSMVGSVHVSQWSGGLIPPNTILNLVDSCSDRFYLVVEGDPNSPISWSGHPHTSDAFADLTHGYILAFDGSRSSCILYQYSAATIDL